MAAFFAVVVRRIGMTKPPVKLGVGKKFLEKRKEPPSGKMNRGRMLSRSYSYASNNSTTFKRIEFYGIFKKQK